MNIRNTFKSFLAIWFLFTVAVCHLSGQAVEEPVPVQSSNALKAFNEERFSEALEIYESLLLRYPRDGVFHYYKGMCLYNLNKDPDKAAESLEFAFSRPNVPNDALFYLGRVYMSNYKFPQAKNAFQRFINVASRQEQRNLNPERYLSNAENAIAFTASYNEYDVRQSAYFKFSDSLQIRQIASAGGRLVRKPDELITPGETEGELTGLIFMPRQLNPGDYIYMSGYSRGRRGGSELYRVKLLNGKRWGKPELLSSLNTEYDEVLPYFDPVGNDLYFASKGHNSMGGFDVFKSRYDETRDNWSEPVNLGFPLNSPFNDYLLIPGANLGNVLLISDRNPNDDRVAVYNIQIREPRLNLSGSDPSELARIAEMGGVKEELAFAQRIAEISPVESPVQESTPVEQSAPVVKSPQRLGTPVIAPDLPSDYQVFLRQALVNQFSADSLSILARQARLKAKEIPDPNQRWALQKDIIEWEKSAREFQSLADNFYNQLKEMEGAGKTAKSFPATITPDTSLGGLTVYRYTNAVEETPGVAAVSITSDPGSLPVADSNSSLPVTDPDKYADQETAMPAAIISRDEPGGEVLPPDQSLSVYNRFVIMDKSPYSASNPFPIDVPLPDGPFYQVQLGVFSQQISYSNFGGISPITGETIEGRGLTRYYAGKFNTYDEAVKAQEQLKNTGYPDAFIVSWYNGQKMPPAKVHELERRDK